MTLHRRMGLIFSSFASLALVYNIFIPDNPDHVLNIIEEGALALLFLLSSVSSKVISISIQLSILTIASFIAAYTDTGFFPSALIMTITMVLFHAYGGFRTRVAIEAPLVTIGAFLACFIASSHFYADTLQVATRAAMWTLAIAFLVFIFWVILQEFRRQFFEDYAKAIVEQNRELLEINKKLAGGCANVTEGK